MNEIRIGDILYRALRVLGRYPLFFLLLAAVAGISWLPEPNTPGWRIAEGLVGLIVRPFCAGMTCYAASQAMQGLPLRLMDAFRTGTRRWAAVLGVELLGGLRILLWSLLLIVPGVIVAAGLAVSMPVCVIEDVSWLDGMRRSFILMDGNRLKIVYLFLIAILGSAILVGLKMWLAPDGPITGLAVRSVVSAYLTVLTVVLYYDLKAASDRRGADAKYR